jgi:hypothetical protein
VEKEERTILFKSLSLNILFLTLTPIKQFYLDILHIQLFCIFSFFAYLDIFTKKSSFFLDISHIFFGAQKGSFSLEK